MSIFHNKEVFYGDNNIFVVYVFAGELSVAVKLICLRYFLPGRQLVSPLFC